MRQLTLPPKLFSRRRFIETTTGAAGAVLLGCKTTTGSEALGDVTAANAGTIVTARIHPGIGVARVGNSTRPDGFYIGPEITTPELARAGETRDGAGAIKRQAARFRIYGYDAQGRCVGEITPDVATVKWTAHLANKKAAWYRFTVALDIPESANTKNVRRNPSVRGDARKRLVIDPGPRSIAGRNTAGAPYQFDTGKFGTLTVPLGELRTDEQGRLLVLGGHGKADSPSNAPIFVEADADSFNNANDWWDDTADGPVSAKVQIGGRNVPVESAWVIVAPPNYARDIIGWRTLHDLLVDTHTEAGILSFPETTSFTRDVYPALQRLANLQWVNRGFAKIFGHGGQAERTFDDPALLAKLATPPQNGRDDHRAVRQQIFTAFRPADPASGDPTAWPWMYGDAFGSFDESHRVNLGTSDGRMRHLKRWADGNFIADWDPRARPPRKLEDVPLADRPAMLDQAALHFCLADAFHPGCEVTWPMRHASMYATRRAAAGQPPPSFRIKALGPRQTASDPGDELTIAKAKSPGGALHEQGPGDLTKWMAIPWHGDTIFCRSGYDPDYDPYLPTFWPARVPNQVLTEADYLKVMDTSLSRDERKAAFARRESWVRAFFGSAPAQMIQMRNQFGEAGIVEARPGIDGDPDFPPVMFVESVTVPRTRGLESVGFGAPPGAPGGGGAVRAARPGSRLQQAGWRSQEELDAARAMRGLRKKRIDE